ncbi:hypothetical protein Y032_0171g309 [Ancylostoma ceylanicum]|nr:hypothetical protein Y032_0171g309 [Ancylostoma ceylanicum]
MRRRRGRVLRCRACTRPPRNSVNGTNCAHPPRQTAHCDSVNWRVEPLKTRRVRDSDTCFSAVLTPQLRLEDFGWCCL